jgi:hypothetical protein
LAVAQAAGELPGASNAIDVDCLLERASLRSFIESKLPWVKNGERCSYPEHPAMTDSE